MICAEETILQLLE